MRDRKDALAALTDHVIARHYPDADGPLALLDRVVAAQAETIAQWMALGFIHGVMNTDNMAISGETIDYGPCAFMDVYHPDTVFSSIDRTGRYAWANQPQIAVWNLAQFATCRIPLMGGRRPRSRPPPPPSIALHRCIRPHGYAGSATSWASTVLRTSR